MLGTQTLAAGGVVDAIKGQGDLLTADVAAIAVVAVGIAFAPTIWKFGLKLFRSISGAR